MHTIPGLIINAIKKHNLWNHLKFNSIKDGLFWLLQLISILRIEMSIFVIHDCELDETIVNPIQRMWCHWSWKCPQ